MDLVPKSIMLHLVNSSMDEMQRTLLNDLYKMDQSEDLLKEPEHIVKRRREVKRMIEALNKADDILSSV
ncbi:putative vacuolar protein sorting-associated protein 1 [Mitosporidium daphniae]|uniref:Putative vacuolar protein sorting-associated protein 1 n=1 Tax=Mitosporidium daphniae TaxID=1485682 RepID=A0A098VVC4_9MICR|nr:putative vacuolar protein sorting-associated protein 1 [Mitosporidium daphniae]KGG52867.1 putative vacuolar protein sorting-associated protein 1 [Mitosporidium daphniae]|eukprot:XP_013239294.1 putative vacuolar protein sorting-associated protein 1 [Mitosporidium daphniae]